MKGAPRILVIGAGSAGRRHHDNLVHLGARAVLLPYREFCDDALARLEAAGGFDGLVIATATQIRADLVALCADRAIPFYVEKPLAFDMAALTRIETLARPLAGRSMIGFMMRYHPAFRHLARMDLSDIYRAGFDIGHDVRQWRQNWRFADSYASRPRGGGVLLDLCHELDMATTLFPSLGLGAVDSLGHAAYPGVDFASRIALWPEPHPSEPHPSESGASESGASQHEASRQGAGPLATVSMDYLSPVSLRRVVLHGQRATVDFDLAAGRYRVARDGVRQDLDFAFERNAMFLAAMDDFLALIAGRPVSDVEHLPRFDLALPSAARIVKAYQARRFRGAVAGDF